VLGLWQLFQNYVASFAQWRATHGAFAVYLIIVCIAKPSPTDSEPSPSQASG